MCPLKENSITIYRLKVIPFAKYYKKYYGHTVKPRLTTISFAYKYLVFHYPRRSHKRDFTTIERLRVTFTANVKRLILGENFSEWKISR